MECPNCTNDLSSELHGWYCEKCELHFEVSDKGMVVEVEEKDENSSSDSTQ